MPTLYRHFTRQEELDREYNPSLAVADPLGEIARYTHRSTATRAVLRGALGVPYGATVEETLDIFPAAQPGAPVFVFIHGGYWRALAARDFSYVARGLHAHGITTVVIDYALCPWVTLDEIVRQSRAAVAWVARHIGEYGGDAARMAIGGHSAGAHLAAMCLATDWAGRYGLPAQPLRAALLASGLYDLAALRYSYLQPALQIDDGVAARLSPLHHVHPNAARTWITWGERESSEFRRQSETFHAAWQQAGNAALCRALPQADHFSVIHGLEDPDSDLSRWLAEALSA